MAMIHLKITAEESGLFILSREDGETFFSGAKEVAYLYASKEAAIESAQAMSQMLNGELFIRLHVTPENGLFVVSRVDGKCISEESGVLSFAYKTEEGAFWARERISKEINQEFYKLGKDIHEKAQKTRSRPKWRSPQTPFGIDV